MGTVGIHLVWTTYGTWLPGDARGHWSPLFDFYGNLVERGGKLNHGDKTTQRVARERMKESAKRLDTKERQVVADTLGTLLGGEGQPRALAAAIEETHVHLLLGPIAEELGTAVGRFKGKTSAAVLAMPGNPSRERTWTAKYWRVFLFDETAFIAVQRYIHEHNLRRSLPANPFAWITSI